MPCFSTDADLSQHEISVLQRREQHGWFVIKIPDPKTGPGFAYSFGLFEEFGQPAIIVFGLAVENMHRLINEIGQRMRGGAKYSAETQVSGLLHDGFICAFKKVDPLHYRTTCNWSLWFYGGSRFPVLQLFWPDKQNLLPWNPGFDEQLRRLQPDLSQPPPSA